MWDITAQPPADSPTTYLLPEGLEPDSVDVITVIYVLSALHPKEWDQAIHNLYAVCPLISQCLDQFSNQPQALKPGGTLFIRDYGRHDLAQLRIKKERLLDPAYPGLYIRGDGTRVYFFPKTELEGLVTAPLRGEDEGAMFRIEDSGEDRRMVCHKTIWCTSTGKADLIVGEPKVEVENVPYMVTDESYEAPGKSGQCIRGFEQLDIM